MDNEKLLEKIQDFSAQAASLGETLEDFARASGHPRDRIPRSAKGLASALKAAVREAADLADEIGGTHHHIDEHRAVLVGICQRLNEALVMSPPRPPPP